MQGQHILDAIGNTPLVELRRIVPEGSARIVAKLDQANPTGSMKDRAVLANVRRAACGTGRPPAPWHHDCRMHQRQHRRIPGQRRGGDGL